jgi:hypothetical protein
MRRSCAGPRSCARAAGPPGHHAAQPGGHQSALRGRPPPRPSSARPHGRRPRDSRAPDAAARAVQVIQDIMLGGPENVSAYCTGDLDELAATAAELNMSTPTSQETLHGDQMGAFAHSVRQRRRAACGTRAAARVRVPARLPPAAAAASCGAGRCGTFQQGMPGVRAAQGKATLTKQDTARRAGSAELWAAVRQAFCLMIAGDSQTSRRLPEALLGGCIPVRGGCLQGVVGRLDAVQLYADAQLLSAHCCLALLGTCAGRPGARSLLSSATTCTACACASAGSRACQ